MKRSSRLLFLWISLAFFSQGNLFSAVTLQDCVDKGGEAVEERGYLKCDGGEYDEEPIITPELEENPEIAPPVSETPKEGK